MRLTPTDLQGPLPPWVFVLALLPLLVGGGLSGAQAQTKGPKKAQPTTCVEVRKETPFFQGYNHIVVLESHCTERQRCEVSTDVNPETQTVEIAPEQVLRLLTFRGSPARNFTPNVVCKPLSKR